MVVLWVGSESTNKVENYQTSAVTSGDFVGACFVIGELKGAQNSLLQKVCYWCIHLACHEKR
ncbi:hypothetical protein LQQ78_25665 (plasmid) [Escherichia coli]|nr:hypothetical protein [Escherichia coli]